MRSAVACSAESSHRMPDHVHRQTGEIPPCRLDKQIGVLHDLFAVFEVDELAHGASVAAVVEPHDGVPGSVELCNEVIIASVMLAESVNDNDDGRWIVGCVDFSAEKDVVVGRFGEFPMHECSYQARLLARTGRRLRSIVHSIVWKAW